MEFLFPVAMFAIIYFFMIRPQAQKNKAQKTFSESLKKGDEVVTNSGLIGKITKVDDNVVTLMVAPKTYMRFFRGSVSKDMTDILGKINTGAVVDTNVE